MDSLNELALAGCVGLVGSLDKSSSMLSSEAMPKDRLESLAFAIRFR